MGADNWAVCPRCRDRAVAAKDALFNEAAAAYGTLPVEEYEALRAKAQAPAEELRRTFAEYYEFYGAENGTVTADYGGECNVCHLKCNFKHQVKFYDGDAG